MKIHKYLLFCWLALLLQLASASPDSDLLAAANGGNIHAIETALSKGANPNQPDAKGVVPLMWAAYQGNLIAVNTLLNAGANINIACTNLNLLPEEPIKYRDTPLGLAVSNGHLQVVQALIAKGANINAENNLRRPALLLAVQSGNTAMVQILINAGANPNSKGGLDESTPLIEAVKSGNQTITNLIYLSKLGGQLVEPTKKFFALAKINMMKVDTANARTDAMQGLKTFTQEIEVAGDRPSEALEQSVADITVAVNNLEKAMNQ